MVEKKNLSQMSKSELEDCLEKACGEYQKVLFDYARAKLDFENLENFENTIYYSAMPQDGTVEDKKKFAYTSDEYVLHLEGLKEARKMKLLHEARYKASLAWYDTVRDIHMKRKETEQWTT